MTKQFLTRRGLLTLGAKVAAISTVPMSMVKLAFADSRQDFTFAYISDAHIQWIKGSEFVRNWDKGLIRAVAETNLLSPAPDFVIFGGDLAQLGRRDELDHGAEMLSALKYKTYRVMGEHDYYLDLGEYWRKLFGPDHYSFDHKGVHFVVLNSILVDEDWTHHKWSSPEERMNAMALLDNPEGSPFLVGDAQRAWLKEDLSKVSLDTPLVVLSHSPLQKIFKNWNFWTDDAEQVQDLLKPFRKVTVLYGHVHQVQYNQIEHITFNSVMSTAWPWPYPQSYVQADSHLPVLTVPMGRQDPFFDRDGTGWQFINMRTGNVDAHYQLYENRNRVVAFNEKTQRPEDLDFQSPDKQLPSQIHY